MAETGSIVPLKNRKLLDNRSNVPVSPYVFAPQCPRFRPQRPGNRPESPFDEQSETTSGPSETQIADRFAPYRCFLFVCYGMPVKG